MEAWTYRGKWALVTGASAGLGVVFAEKLAAREMHLVLTARRRERLDALADRLTAQHGVTCRIIPADLLQTGEPERVWAEATTGTTIDLLVNNAGFGAQGHFSEVPLDKHLAVMKVNCDALVVLSHLALQQMRPRRAGAIINVSSIAAFQPVPRLAVYAATKSFVLSLSEAMWVENRDYGIRVLALCPGRTPTEFQEVAGTSSAEGAFGFRTPEQVVEAGLEALERDRSSEVPGFENRAATWAARALPRRIVVPAMRAIIRHFWKR